MPLHTYVHACVCTCICLHICVCIHVHVIECVYACGYVLDVYACFRIHVCVCMTTERVNVSTKMVLCRLLKLVTNEHVDKIYNVWSFIIEFIKSFVKT
jgi:hypothetical protein